MSEQLIADVLMSKVLAGLRPLATQLKAPAPVLARDPFHVLEILGESPAGLRLILHWAGEDDIGEQEEMGVVDQRVELVVSFNLGMGIDASRPLTTPVGGRPALFSVVAKAKARMRSFRFDTDVSKGAFRYRGCDPVVTPDGIPLSAYRLRFSIESMDDQDDTEITL